MERIVIINFGAQYNQLIARRVREAGVYSELLPPDSPIEKIKGDGLCGIILSGGPDSAYLEGSRTTSCSISACPCLASATECSLCAKNSAAKSAPLRRVNTAKHPCISNAAHCLRTCLIQ